EALVLRDLRPAVIPYRSSIGDNHGCPMASSHCPHADEPADEVGDDEIRRTALFLVRVFGMSAAEVAAERSHKSEQAGEWRRVALEFARLRPKAGRGAAEARLEPQP